jgi:hypothetical protein
VRERSQERLGGSAPKIIEDNVDRILGDFLAKGRNQPVVLLIE